MAHPTRTGDVVAFSYPPYQFDAETPGTLVAPSHFFGQHGYVPDVQNLSANVNMRATFLAGGEGVDKGTCQGADDRPRADARVPARHPRAAAQPGEGPARRRRRPSVQGDLDRRAERLPRSARADDARVRRPQPARSAAPPSSRRCSTRTWPPCPEPGLILAAGDNVGASPPNSLLLEDMPAIDVENAWGLDATSYGNHEFDFGVARLLQQQARANFPFLATNIIETRPASARLGDAVERVHRQRREGRRHRRRAEEHAGARLRRHDGRPPVPGRGAAHQGRVRAARAARRQGADRRHPPGHGRRGEHRRQRAGAPWEGPILGDRRRAAGHDGRRHDRRPHAPRLEPDARRHPDHRGDQRRHQLLRAPADHRARRRRRGPAAQPGSRRRWASPRGPMSRRSSTTPTRRPPCCATR